MTEAATSAFVQANYLVCALSGVEAFADLELNPTDLGFLAASICLSCGMLGLDFASRDKKEPFTRSWASRGKNWLGLGVPFAHFGPFHGGPEPSVLHQPGAHFDPLRKLQVGRTRGRLGPGSFVQTFVQKCTCCRCAGSCRCTSWAASRTDVVVAVSRVVVSGRNAGTDPDHLSDSGPQRGLVC